MNGRCHETRCPAHAERGAVLILGLIMLLVMTLMAVGAMSTTTLHEAFSANRQYKVISFQAAESVIRKAWNITLFGASMAKDESGDTVDAVVDEAPHAFGSTEKMQVESSARVHYCGVIPATRKTELNADMSAIVTAEQWFDVKGKAELAVANTHAIHVQGASVLGPVPGGTETTCAP